MGFKELVANTFMIGLFVIAIIAFAVNLGLENNTKVNVLNDTSISSIYTSMNDTMIDSQGDLGDKWGSLSQDTPTVVTNIGLFTIPRLAFKIPTTTYNIMVSILDFFSRTLRIPPVIIYGLMSILIISIIVAGISLFRSGR